MSSNPPNLVLPSDSSADQLTIQTPEQTDVDFAIAGIGSRFLAIAYDTLWQILIGLVGGIAGVFMIMGVEKIFPLSATWLGAIYILFYFFLYFGYYPLFEILWNGQTPGKRKQGIRVIKDSGRPLTPAETIGRNLLRIVDWMPFFYGVGMLTAFLNKRNKRLGDLVVGALVVREASLSELKPIWQAAPEPTAASAGPLGANLLTADECALIDSFLNRRNSLDYNVRVRMAEEIFRRLKPKLTLPAENLLSTEKILETLAYERRATGSYS
ncbi:MAG TPA: RDD family protein [Candidatus Acidoferrum sp.]|nr:RDD family protein [Candidatus Acidoferrum sp.]